MLNPQIKSKMKIITENNLPIITTNHPEIPELIELLTGVQGDIQDFIEYPDSPLGDLSAELHSIVYHATEDTGTITITFDITKCEDDDQEAINIAATEACTATHGLPEVLSYQFDMLIGEYKYLVTPNTLVFIATFEF